jgi:hypothetical protein
MVSTCTVHARLIRSRLSGRVRIFIRMTVYGYGRVVIHRVDGGEGIYSYHTLYVWLYDEVLWYVYRYSIVYVAPSCVVVLSFPLFHP